MDNAFMISAELFRMELKPRAFMVFCCLMTYANKEGDCFPSRATIARQCNVDRKTVDAAIRELEEKGLVTKRARQRRSGGTTSNLYTLTTLPFLISSSPYTSSLFEPESKIGF